MLKILKYLVILIVVVVGLAVAGYSFIPSSFIQNQAEKAIEDATQRDVTITGLELKRWAPLGATVTGVSIANAEWAQDPELAKIQSIEADVSVWSLITGSPSAFVLTVQQPEIYLEVDENGQANYQFETASDDSDATGEPSEPDTSEPSERSGVNIPVRPEIRVENGLVVYRNKQEGIEKQFENVSLSITQESETSPLLLKGNVDSDGKSATLDGQIANLDALASGSETDIDVKLTAPGLDFSITGAVDPTAQTTTSDIDLQLSGPRELASWLGQAIPLDEPALSSVSLTAKIDGAAEEVDATGIVLKVDDIEGKGEVHAEMSGARPSVTTKMVFGDVDLTPYVPAETADASGQPEEAPAESAEPASQGWPDDPLDLPLPLPIDLDVDIEMASLKTPQITASDIKALLTADEQTTEAKLVDIKLYEGTLNTTATVTSGEVPDFAVNLETKDGSLLQLLKETAGFERLEGKGNAQLDVTSSGNSVKAIIENLNGNGSILARDGAILGINIAAFMREVMTLGLSEEDDGPERTDFAEAGGTFTIEKGVVTNQDFTMRAPVLRIAGAGTVDLPNQSLDYTVKPQLAATLEGQDAGGDDAFKAGLPIVISGPWTDPGIKLDVGGSLTSAIQNPADVGKLVDQIKTSPEMLKDLQEQFNIQGLSDLGGEAADQLKGLLGGGAESGGDAGGDAGGESLQDKATEGAKGLLDSLSGN